MKYTNAKSILPEELLTLIQDYIDGEYLYIPRKQENQKSWGEKNGAKKGLLERNRDIYEHYLAGIPISELAHLHFLSEKSIRRIIAQQKNGPIVDTESKMS